MTEFHASDRMLEALARFAAVFAAPNFTAGTPRGGGGQMPWFEASADISAFLAMAQAEGWMMPGFDWMAWRSGADGQRLLTDPAATDHAGPLELARIVTTIIRMDRFNDGHLAACARSGLLGRISARAHDILAARR